MLEARTHEFNKFFTGHFVFGSAKEAVDKHCPGRKIFSALFLGGFPWRARLFDAMSSNNRILHVDADSLEVIVNLLG